MYLKSLVLKGFKSFADRSVLSFEPGIAAIVGPNGAGKSNISDAILWVLGERNARNLRGQAMEDVIFAGSSARKSVSVAEVELVLDNSDGTLPVDYSQVVIARRMYRSGESEYLVNGTVVRRMDVLDILHDSGIGSGAHSVISQGKLESVLQSKPEDRRALIEDAAGVLKHKQRKEKSERKLERMDVHLTRVQDIATEVERQLKPLERKAKRALAYQEISGELAELNLGLAVDDLRLLQASWNELVQKESALADELDVLRGGIDGFEAQIEVLQGSIREQSKNLSKTANEYRRMQNNVERFESLRLLLQEKKHTLEKYRSEHGNTHKALENKWFEAQSQGVDVARQLDEVRKEEASLDETLAVLVRKQKTNYEARVGLEQKIADKTEREQASVKEREGAFTALNRAKELLSGNVVHERMISTREKELRLETEKLEVFRGELQGISEKQGMILEKAKKKEEEARLRLATLEQEREKLLLACEEAREKQALLSSELRALDEYERASAGTNRALSWVYDNGDKIDGDLMPLSRIIKAPEDLESLVGKLLGRDMRAFTTTGREALRALIAGVEASEASGELVLFDASVISGFESRNLENGNLAKMSSKYSEVEETTFADAFDGISEEVPIPLLDLLEYPEDKASLVESLFAHVYLCESVDRALHLATLSDPELIFATRQGFVACANGRVSLGIDESFESGILAHNRHREELVRELEEQTQLYEKYVFSKEELDKAFRKARDNSLVFSQEFALLQGQSDSAQEESKRIEEQYLSKLRDLEILQKQWVEVQGAIKQAQPVSEELEERIRVLEAAVRLLRQERELEQEQLEPLQIEEREIDGELADYKLQQATLCERRSYLERVLKAHKRDVEELSNERKALEGTMAVKQLASARIEPLLERINTLLAGAKRRESLLRAENAGDQEATSGLHIRLQEERGMARKAQLTYDESSERLSELRIEKGRLEVRVESAVNLIVEDCGVVLDVALAQPKLEDRATTEELAGKLRRRIANMGSINPDAATEYEDLKERFDYIRKQLADLLYARRALQKIIRMLDERMKREFIETFNQVDENFRKIFEALFPGGSAQLSLEDPHDPENSGVEVSAQPRGKRITKMTLMSGGEKSLTALALLFAIYQRRSTPFYILDEVEAALDDSNLRRFCTYLDSLRTSIQLVMITHQRRTMELADVLYGISMQADGVTRVVSQKLERSGEVLERNREVLHGSVR